MKLIQKFLVVDKANYNMNLNLKTYFSPPACINSSGKIKRSGIPSIVTKPYNIQTKIPDHKFIKYKPEANVWNYTLKKQNQKIIYALCSATNPNIPMYIGETHAPLKCINQHIKEAVILNYPSYKADWIRKLTKQRIQIILRPLILVDAKYRLSGEKLIRALLSQLKFKLFNGARASANTYYLIEKNKIYLTNASPFLLTLINNTMEQESKIRDKLINML